MAKQNRNRVFQDRLWDDTGQEWTTTLGTWLTARDVEQLVRSSSRVLVYGSGRPFRWIDRSDAQSWWTHARNHLAVPGVHGAQPDDGGLTYAATKWHRGNETLLAFHLFC